MSVLHGGSMQSQQELDAVVSMIMVNLPFPPMPVVVRRGSGEEASCSSHDLLSRAISCSLVESWKQLDGTDETVHQADPKQNGKMQVLLNLNNQNARQCKENRPTTETVYELFGQAFRDYMAFYPGSPDIRFLPIDSVDRQSTIHAQALQHIQAKRINTQDARVTNSSCSYAQLIDEYSKDLYLESKE